MRSRSGTFSTELRNDSGSTISACTPVRTIRAPRRRRSWRGRRLPPEQPGGNTAQPDEPSGPDANSACPNSRPRVFPPPIPARSRHTTGASGARPRRLGNRLWGVSMEANGRLAGRVTLFAVVAVCALGAGCRIGPDRHHAPPGSPVIAKAPSGYTPTQWRAPGSAPTSTAATTSTSKPVAVRAPAPQATPVVGKSPRPGGDVAKLPSGPPAKLGQIPGTVTTSDVAAPLIIIPPKPAGEVRAPSPTQPAGATVRVPDVRLATLGLPSSPPVDGPVLPPTAPPPDDTVRPPWPVIVNGPGGP